MWNSPTWLNFHEDQRENCENPRRLGALSTSLRTNPQVHVYVDKYLDNIWMNIWMDLVSLKLFQCHAVKLSPYDTSWPWGRNYPEAAVEPLPASTTAVFCRGL